MSENDKLLRLTEEDHQFMALIVAHSKEMVYLKHLQKWMIDYLKDQFGDEVAIAKAFDDYIKKKNPVERDVEVLKI